MVPLESWWKHAPKKMILSTLWASCYIFKALSRISKQASKCRISAGYLITCHQLLWSSFWYAAQLPLTCHSRLLFQFLMPTSNDFETPAFSVWKKYLLYCLMFKLFTLCIIINRLLPKLYLYCLSFLDCCRWNSEVLPSWYAWEEPKTDLVWAVKCAVTFVLWWARPKLVGSTWV